MSIGRNRGKEWRRRNGCGNRKWWRIIRIQQWRGYRKIWHYDEVTSKDKQYLLLKEEIKRIEELFVVKESSVLVAKINLEEVEENNKYKESLVSI